MGHPLDGARAKLARGIEHAHELKAAFAEADAIPVVTEFVAEEQVVHVKLGKIPAPAQRWSLLAGDTVQNFRAALDYLAWELAKWNLHAQGADREPFRKTSFPIYDDPAKLVKDWIPRAGKDIADRHRTMCQALQPYQNWDVTLGSPKVAATWRIGWSGKWHPLDRLHKLANDDKHRTLGIITTAVMGGSVGPVHGVNCEVGGRNWLLEALTHPLKEGATWMIVEVSNYGASEPEVHVHDELIRQEQFEDRRGASETLAAIAAVVRLIIDRFEPEFA